MRNNVLVNNREKYSGNYVATKSFKDKTVVSNGKDAAKVSFDAKKKRVESPVVFYVPKKGMVNIY